MTRFQKILLFITLAAAVAAVAGWILAAKIVMGLGIALFCVAGWFFLFAHYRPVWVRAALMVLLMAILGFGLYGFNAFRAEAINNAFNNMKMPPTPVAVAVAKKQELPRYAPGIGTLQ